MSGRPVLIVDDDPLMYDGLATALEFHGFSTRIATDGRAALAAVEAERPSIVLLDLHMPNLDGAGFLRELEARGIHLPIVLMTADENGEAVARKLGVTVYLRKPFGLPRLFDAIAACSRPARERHRGGDHDQGRRVA